MLRLSAAFTQACAPEVAAQLETAQLEPLLTAHFEAAVQAWPTVKVDDITFVTHVARRMQGDVDAEKALRGLHAADLYLALACGLGNHRALLELEKLFKALPASLARLASLAPVDEVVQALRAKSLVARGGSRPQILDYAGRGPLAGWLRVAAIRMAVSLGRKGNVAAAAPVTREVLLAVPDLAADPEIAHLRVHYASEFKSAFEDAVAALPVEQRNVLRLSLVDRLSIDEIGTIFHVHRATAARWIQRGLDAVQQNTRGLLLARLKLSDSELDSLMVVVRGSLELSIQRVLGGSHYPIE